MTVDSTKPATVAAPALFPGWISRLTIAAALILLVAIRLIGQAQDPPDPLNDPAIRNLLTLILSFIAALTLWLWFCFRSGYSLAARRTVFLGTFAALGLLFAGMRFREFSGSMVPTFVPRWTEAVPDQRLGDPEIAATATPIDLSSTSAGDFPQFLGPERSGWIPGPEIARDWAAHPPKLLWKRPIGAGWSAFSAVNGYAITQEQRGENEWVTCYEMESGKPVWSHSTKGRHENPMGGIGPRGTPTVHQGRVYALGATGVMQCLDGATGKLLWSDDLRARYHVVPDQGDIQLRQKLVNESDEALVMWGRAASPLIVENLVVVPAGGPAGKAKNLIAFDADTGRVVWESENVLSELEDKKGQKERITDQIAYASPSLATLAGRRQILIVNESTASGHDPATGERLWSFPWPGHSNGDASSSQAVAIDDNHVLLSKGYSGGAELVELLASGEGGPITAESKWKVPRVLQTKFTNVVVRDGHAYGLSEGILECVELSAGKRKWKNGRYEHGQILGVGNLLLVLSEEGELHLVELNPSKFNHLASLPALTGKTWNNLCLAGNRLLVRNAEEAACYELP